MSIELLWIPVTCCAACAQVARTGLQKSLTADIDQLSATWVRSAFALPFVPLLLGLLVFGNGIPAFSIGFIGYCVAAALGQIIATFLLLALFQYRHFAVGTVFAKSEALQVALLGIVIFAEPPSLTGLMGILIGGLAVALLIPWRRELAHLTVWYGLGAGFGFALTTWFIRSAYQYADGSTLEQALLALAVVISTQTVLLGGYLSWKNADFSAIWRVRRRALATGGLSMLGSLCWFWAFALTNPAYVKTLAQIELPLAYLVGRAAFAEKPGKLEIAGMTTACVGAIIVAFA